MNRKRWIAGAAALAFAGAGSLLPGNPAGAEEGSTPDCDHAGMDHEGHEGHEGHRDHDHGDDHEGHEGHRDHDHGEDHEAPAG